MRDEGDDDSSISAAGDHETGTAGSLPETWTHYPSVQAARAGAKVMYHNDRVLRVMMVTDSGGSFVEWIER